jgi:hypothetical protein
MKGRGCILYKTTLALFVLVAVNVGHAQYESQSIRVKIPFDFNIGQQRFLAGEYSLKPLFQNTTILRDERGEVLTGIGTISVESREVPTSTKLIFNRYNDRYFLSQIWEAGNEIGRELTKLPVEREIAKRDNSPGEQIALTFAPPH